MGENDSRKTRRFLQGAAAVLTSLAGSIGTANATAIIAPQAVFAGQTHAEFVIAPAVAQGAKILAHSSHSSHDSHSSHSSHSSHVSSS